MSQACIAIVDPYSSGALLVDALVARGAMCVAIESAPTLPISMKSHFSPSVFTQIIRHDGNLEQTLYLLSQHAPSHVIAGFESGVELAEELSERLELPGNAADGRQSRRDKFLMAEAVRRHGLRTPLQFQSSDIDELVDWACRHLDWPMIVKPLKSAASDQVQCCYHIDQLRVAATSILAAINILGRQNTSVLVQEFLDGTEYAIDTVTCGAQTKLTAIWQYDRPTDSDGFICYDAMRLLPYEGQRQKALQDYALDVLRALGISFGPAHCEIMWVGDGPVFIEAGARMSAGVNAVLSRECGGICQLDETVDLLLDPDAFRATLGRRPQLERRAINVFLMPSRPGTLVGTRHVDELQQLPTLHSLSLVTQKGEVLQRVAGRVTLVDHSIEALERDIATIRALQRDGIFQVQETTST